MPLARAWAGFCVTPKQMLMPRGSRQPSNPHCCRHTGSGQSAGGSGAIGASGRGGHKSTRASDDRSPSGLLDVCGAL